MLPTIDPSQTQAWSKLKAHFASIKEIHMKSLFTADPDRFTKFSTSFEDILLDYSKNRISQETMDLLFELADEVNLQEAKQQMFNGDKINVTEDRAVLHVALRNRSGKPIIHEGKDITADVNSVLDRMKSFTDKLHSGQLKGYTGKPIQHIVNIGIGGSDLGPYMV
ncbi:MAG: glucose-6-phosphate isomerase, partial [Marinoscillum sp.]